MEGKSGINIVMTILAILFIVAGIALCVLFGIGQTLPSLPLAVNLYAGIAALGVGCIMLVLTNIATNARIAADNTYDTLYRLGLLAKLVGVDEEDLKIPAKEKLKALKKEKELQAALQKDADEQAAIESIVAQESTAAVAEEAPVQEAQEAEAPAPSAAPDSNWGLDVEQWKKALAGKVTCACCGAQVSVHKTKKGVGVLMCPNVKKDGSGCESKPITLDKVGELFMQWYSACYEEIDKVDLDKLGESVGSISLEKDGDMRFVAK
ncbi:MAG: zinc ribbon domain-containing protein [Clostridia bacterium]|nr:zinc ribbon domain-containing protein [Clostridia bacterium]